VNLVIEHRIGRPVEEVEKALLERSFAARLAASAGVLRHGEVLAIEERKDGSLARRAHFVAAGAVSLGLLGRYGAVGWREEVVWDREHHRGVFTVTPDVPAVVGRRVACEGTYGLHRERDGATRRVIRLRCDVRVPLLGPEVEARVGALLRDLFDAEAKLLGGGP
jgi:hypothetical protein